MKSSFMALGLLPLVASAFCPAGLPLSSVVQQPKRQQSKFFMANNNNNKFTDEEASLIEESRRKVLESRRESIRGTIKFADKVRNLRLKNGWVPEVDPETGKPTQDSAKNAVTWTAFAVAAGVVALRIGGRAALISAVGLDFASDNPELKEQLDSVLAYADSMNIYTKALTFTAAWTAVKVFLFDAGGIVLALSAGILFGGVLQGAFASAAAATIASLVCFALAKADTPVREKALQIVEEYPSLRGIEKVVAEDGFKAILTLRLAPILPIPLGLYNYVYGVTNVPLLDFGAGIFVGSFKPYLLDSYLGYFGKTILDGSAGDSSWQDAILLLALGASVLIGVFASQLAGETWDSVLQEIESERKEKEDPDAIETLVATKFGGMELPDWVVDWQVEWGQAEERMLNMVDVERDARVWNYTKPELIPQDLNPALFPNSPEVQEFGTGFPFKASTLDGLTLSPVLFSVFAKYADPLFDEEEDEEELTERTAFRNLAAERKTEKDSSSTAAVEEIFDMIAASTREENQNALKSRVAGLKTKTQRRLARLEDRILLLDESSSSESTTTTTPS